MSECANCGNQSATRWKLTFSKEGRFEECDQCSKGSFNTGIPDVYWPGHQHKDSNIVDLSGNEILLESRRHKAELLRERGMREGNDRVHGGPGHRFGTR